MIDLTIKTYWGVFCSSKNLNPILLTKKKSYYITWSVNYMPVIYILFRLTKNKFNQHIKIH